MSKSSQNEEMNSVSFRQKITAVVMILAAAAGWGVIGVFSRPMNASGLSVIQITFFRSLTVCVGMGLFLLIRDRSLFRIRLKDCWMFLGTGLVSIVFFNACYFLTIQRTTLAVASVLLYTAPSFVMILSAIFFKERITLQKLIALGLAFFGCIAACGFAGGGLDPMILLTGIGAGLGYASYSIFGKAALKKYHTFTLVFYTFAIASLGILPFAGIPEMFSALSAHTDALYSGLGLGLLSTFMPYLCYTGGLKYVEAGKASVMAFAEPMVAAVAGIVIFNERPDWKNLLGILLIFAAIVLLNIPLGKKKNNREL